MRPRCRRGYWIALLLIAAGSAGILVSPSLSVRGGSELIETTSRTTHELPTGTVVSFTQSYVPSVRNERGLAFMHPIIVLSMATLFTGVHLWARQRRLALRLPPGA